MAVVCRGILMKGRYYELRKFILCFICLFTVISISGCIEAVDSLTVYSDGSCLESKSLAVSSIIPGSFDHDEIKAFEKDGYEVRFFSRKDKTDIFITKRFPSLEEYSSFVSSADRMYSGKVKCEISELNLFFLKRIKIRETVAAAEASRIPAGIGDSVFSEKRTITMPYEIISSNADSISGHTALWNIDSSRRANGYVREVVCQYINYVLIVIAAAVAGAVLLMLQKRRR